MLNEQQREAVLTTEGPLLILAGAGSGKTRVLTYRTAYLIDECGVNPYNIMAITFTNKAAGEMRERLRKACKSRESIHDADQMSFWRETGRKVEYSRISTIHAFCGGILRRYALTAGSPPDFDTITEIDGEGEAPENLSESAGYARRFPRRDRPSLLVLPVAVLYIRDLDLIVHRALYGGENSPAAVIVGKVEFYPRHALIAALQLLVHHAPVLAVLPDKAFKILFIFYDETAAAQRGKFLTPLVYFFRRRIHRRFDPAHICSSFQKKPRRKDVHQRDYSN